MSTRILVGDCREILKTLDANSIDCVVTSPPYFGLRAYLAEGHPDKSKELGLEASPAAYVAEMVAIFREVRRVMKKTGTCWIIIGDSYAGHNPTGFRRGNETKNGGVSNKNGIGIIAGLKAKDLIGIPWWVVFALQDDGWYLRQDIIWHKLNPMPESVRDRCTKAHEYVFLLSKSARYFYDGKAIAESFADERMGASGVKAGVPENYAHAAGRGGDNGLSSFNGEGRVGRNKRSVWSLASRPFAQAHFATFPPKLVELCLKAGCPLGGTVLDPFGGAGTTCLVADRMGLDSILIELNPEYAEMAKWRLIDEAGMFARIAAE